MIFSHPATIIFLFLKEKVVYWAFIRINCYESPLLRVLSDVIANLIHITSPYRGLLQH
jgi:hypothetical protein